MLQVQNPANGEVITNVPLMGKRETDDAISSAYDAFKCKFQRLVLTKAYMCQEISYNVRLKC